MRMPARRALGGRRQPRLVRRPASRGRAGGSRRPGRRLSPGAPRAARRGTMPASRGAGPARCGGHTRPGGRGPRAVGPGGPGRCGRHAPRWGPASAGRARRGWAWRHARAPGGPAVVGGRVGVGARMGAPCWTWGPWWPRATSRGATPFPNGSAPRARAKTSPGRHGGRSCCPSVTPCCSSGRPGKRRRSRAKKYPRPLDNQDSCSAPASLRPLGAAHRQRSASKRCATKHWQLRGTSDNMIFSFCKEDC
jgi:hypothetical protein